MFLGMNWNRKVKVTNIELPINCAEWIKYPNQLQSLHSWTAYTTDSFPPKLRTKLNHSNVLAETQSTARQLNEITVSVALSRSSLCLWFFRSPHAYYSSEFLVSVRLQKQNKVSTHVLRVCRIVSVFGICDCACVYVNAHKHTRIVVCPVHIIYKLPSLSLATTHLLHGYRRLSLSVHVQYIHSIHAHKYN